MQIGQWIALAVLVFLIGYTIMIYNNLVGLKHAVTKALANIDIALKQRHDELPKLIETCKQYMGYEKDTLTQVIEARSQVASAQESGDMTELGKPFALAEDYPDLKADQSFQHLQQRITGLEHSIADRREVYNESVNNNNV